AACALAVGAAAPSARADSAVAWGKFVNDTGTLGGAGAGRNTPIAIVGLESGVTALAAGKLHGFALQNGAVYAWGTNVDGELGDGTTTYRSLPVPVVGLQSGVTAIASGAGHGFALRGDALYAWGGNSAGQLGDGTTTNRTTPVLVSGMESGVIAV